MGVKEDVFSSKAEKKNYIKLSRNWGKDYILYHNIPFLNIFTLDDLCDLSDWKNPTPISLNDDERTALKHASVDYVLCDLYNKPLVAIEFDGLQDGFSVGTDYYPERGSNQLRPWRKKKTELKLKVAHGSLFPFFVVGSNHFKDITPHSKMTIVDGVIGAILSVCATRLKISSGFNPEEMGYRKEEFDKLSPSIQHEVIQDWVIGVEVDMDLEHNPVSRRRAEEEYRLNVNSFKVEYLQYPQIPPNAKLDERAALFLGAMLHGAKVTLSTQSFGEIEGVSWIPNFKMVNFSPLGLAEDISALIALDKLRHKLGRSP